MSIILSDVGAEAILSKYFKGIGPTNSLLLSDANNYLLKLYINDIVPTDTDTSGSFVEVTDADAGYSDIELVGANFTVSQVNNISEARYAQQTFLFTGALTSNATIYGYYIVDSDGVLIYAERAAVSFTPVSPGDAVLLTPIFQLSKGVPT